MRKSSRLRLLMLVFEFLDFEWGNQWGMSNEADQQIASHSPVHREGSMWRHLSLYTIADMLVFPHRTSSVSSRIEKWCFQPVVYRTCNSEIGYVRKNFAERSVLFCLIFRLSVLRYSVSLGVPFNGAKLLCLASSAAFLYFYLASEQERKQREDRGIAFLANLTRTTYHRAIANAFSQVFSSLRSFTLMSNRDRCSE